MSTSQSYAKKLSQYFGAGNSVSLPSKNQNLSVTFSASQMASSLSLNYKIPEDKFWTLHILEFYYFWLQLGKIEELKAQTKNKTIKNVISLHVSQMTKS